MTIGSGGEADKIINDDYIQTGHGPTMVVGHRVITSAGINGPHNYGSNKSIHCIMSNWKE